MDVPVVARGPRRTAAGFPELHGAVAVHLHGQEEGLSQDGDQGAGVRHPVFGEASPRSSM